MARQWPSCLQPILEVSALCLAIPVGFNGFPFAFYSESRILPVWYPLTKKNLISDARAWYNVDIFYISNKILYPLREIARGIFLA